MRFAKEGFVLPLFGILANAAGGLLYRAEGPDNVQSFASLAGAFLLFLSYLFSQLSWGALAGRLLGRGLTLPERFFFGSAWLTFLLSVLGLFPVVGAGSRPFWNLLLVSGCGAALVFSRPAEKGFSFHWIDGVALLVFAAGLVGTFIPHPFFDSLWYHLTASRLWFDAGRIHLPEIFPVALKTGLWDVHFLLGQILLGGEEGGGLIAAHLFGQWAGFTCMAASFFMLRQLGRGISPFAALAGVLGTELFAVAEFAKNDWAAVFYSLAALWFLPRAPLLTGLAAGLAFAAKFTAAFFLAPLLLLLAWERRHKPLVVAGAAGLFLLAAAPLLLRNLYFTGNPFFPALSGIFPSLLGPTWENIAVFERPEFSLAAFGEKLRFLLLDSKAVLGLLLLPLAWRHVQGRAWIGLAALSSLLFFLFTGPKAEWRLAGAALLLIGAYGALSLELAGKRFFGPRSLWVLVPALLALSFSIRIPQENPALRIRSFSSGGALAWVRMHGEDGALAATLNEQRIYYLFPRPPLRAFDFPELDLALHRARTEEEMVEVFRKRKVRYLVLSAEFLDLYYDRRVVSLAYQLSERHPNAVVYRAELSRVLDLKLLP